MREELLDRYAALVVRLGLNVQPGQWVLVRALVEHAPVARKVVEHAYLAGARRVDLQYTDQHARRHALDHAPLDALGETPPYELERIEALGRAGGAVVTLTGNPEPALFDGVPADRLAAAIPRELAQVSRRVLLGGHAAWAIVAAPNEGWAREVFGTPDVDRLWEAVAVAMRLDEPDPVAEWQRHRDELIRRAQALTHAGLDRVRYHGGGTDLTLGLFPGALWRGGSSTTRAGVLHMPNLPTEEVFTSPDRRRAEGVVRITRPLVSPTSGVLVEDLRLEVDGGRIVGAQAARGEQAVAAELDVDEGARSFGEIAIVDGGSRVRAAGIVFHDTLYDENAGAHVAWGQGFPDTVPDGLDMPQDELFARGVNRSGVHTDIVVGGPGVDIDGTDADGRVVPIVRDDVWVLPVP